MTDKKNGVLASALKMVLYIISWFYGAISGAVKLLYRINMLKSEKLPCRVISVGNISLGGTGKTPTACMLAKKLKNGNKNVALLTRGYGDDEWKMMEKSLEKIPVVVGQNRVRNSKYAILKFKTDTVVLDDGFQHWKIKRDLDIVLVDSTNPFGNEHLFPRGVLREWPDALKRADLLMLTKTDMKKDNLRDIKIRLKAIAPDIPLLESVYTPKGIYDLSTGGEVELSQLNGKKVAALSSIVNTEYFGFMLKKLGMTAELQFYYPDHYHYKQKDIEDINKRCKTNNVDTIITTEKDAIKLPLADSVQGSITILVLHVEPEVIKGEEILNRRLDSLYSA